MRSRVAKLRRQRGISAYRLAKEAGVSRSMLTKWERDGIYHAELGCAVKVARALRVPVEDLYEEEP
ncbi:helix-turn-helix transcriptional regulator [Enorma massiliensis]|uniref:helix-turn-helix transcriptional regulator n=1 Tax=Enorma massiliensis TaxID=1472761 RepID=UPI0023F1B64E|nr:helix-turn-helix domain-containing protein [Enorma massiliensis]